MTEPPQVKPDSRATARNRLQEVFNLLGAYVLVAALFVAGCVVSDKFLTVLNLTTAVKTVTLLGIVCVGVSFITYSRHYVDLSIPGIMALSGIIAVSALKYGIVASMLAGLGAGLAVGVINGLVVGYLRLNPIIWTLAMVSALSGVIRWAYGGAQVYPNKETPAGAAFLGLYGAEVGGLPLTVLILIVLAALAHWVMKHTPYGARLKLTGSNYEVARMTGVDVRRTIALAFVISSATSALAGIFLSSLNQVGASYVGQGKDFAAITAVVLGGMTLAGGRGSIIGVLGGVMVIGLLDNVLSLVKVGNFVIGDYPKQIIQGAVFILVVGLQSYGLRRTGVDDG